MTFAGFITHHYAPLSQLYATVIYLASLEWSSKQTSIEPSLSGNNGQLDLLATIPECYSFALYLRVLP